ncbi:alpha/beta hydrolase [Streptosporangium carneum]|uniref:Alpha/beta hydrolase n=1 Tax=Streptosporangium carneum TaxID=47481 RepID=A0A9W6HUQ5_9ACTN|nr:alpha/beta hydrolase [Streptosporangium carneum]GLK06692.1 alpha/beta hydrolase [Streptosporangium carneum]
MSHAAVSCPAEPGSTGRRGLRALAAAAALTLTGLGLTSAPAVAETPAGADGPARFHHQRLDWHGCRTGPDDKAGETLDAAGAQCAEVVVPLDYRRPGGRTIKVAISRIKATDPAKRRGVLLTNPGGPGASGLDLVVALAQGSPALRSHYDLIGMDPRFVGRSTPIHCGWKTGTFLRSAGPNRRTFDESAALMKELAAGCARGNRDVLPYASTRNTARDMDVIRAALGEQKLSYLGYSYGTYLGAVYTQMFGANAGRIVLDSAVDPDVYGPRLLSRNAPAITAALKHWAAWAAEHDKEHGLGDTTAEVLATVNRVNQAAARRPLRIGEYRVDSHHVPYLLFGSLYNDSAEAYADFATQVRTLADAARGTVVTAPPSLKATLDSLFTGAGALEAQAPIICADRAASRDPETYFRDIQAHRADEPLFGPLIRNITPCAFWPTAPVEPTTTIRNDVPVLIAGNDGDPASHYLGQQVMHRALTGSRMVTLRGAYRHAAYLGAGNSCVNATVERYLVDGVLPDGDVTCDRDGAPAG